ncbi:MAG: hypothetical protein ACJ751_20405 [Niastella sp.]|uniref:hypothetical protein n=1 Tax=Niastella sp. TaxID=1869183 RepID=UPI00389ABE75
MIVLPGNRFAVADKYRVEVYDLTDYQSAFKCWEHEVENEVVAVFPGPNRDQIGVLESNGKITLHNIKESE